MGESSSETQDTEMASKIDALQRKNARLMLDNERMYVLAAGFGEAAEFWRKLFHREHSFVFSCCDASESVQFLKILEKDGEVTRETIRDALVKARETYRDFTNEIVDKDIEIENLRTAIHSTLDIRPVLAYLLNMDPKEVNALRENREKARKWLSDFETYVRLTEAVKHV
jgi:hypothetical protein